MHKWGKSIMECVKTKIDAMGMDNLNTENIEELKAWVCIAKDIAEYDYYYHIVKAMEENPQEKYGETYDENGRYYSQPRMSNGQFGPDMRKRGFDEMYGRMPMYYDDMQNGRMYFTTSDAGTGSTLGASNMSSTSTRGYGEGRYDMAKRGYEEAKMINPSSDNMEKIQDVFEALKSDMKEIKPKMTQSEKTYARNELTNMANSLV